MSDFPVVNGRSTYYPQPGEDYGGWFHDGIATFFLPGDFLTLEANALLIPNLPISVLSANRVTVSESFFGMSIKDRENDSVQGLEFKITRSHDLGNGKGRWQKIETSPGIFDWTDVDLWVAKHHAAGREMIFTLFGTPAFYAARASEVGIYGPVNVGLQSEPSDMTKWDAFCAAVATRYRGKIRYYEVWNEPNMNNDGTGPTATGVSTKRFFFSGTFAKLSEMTRRAAQAIKAVDPDAKIICPPVQGWEASGTNNSGDYFVGMMNASTGAGTFMKDVVDIVGVHLYLPTLNRIQDLSGAIDRVNAAKATVGVSGLETWDTESAPIGGDMIDLTDEKAKALTARMFLTMAAKGIARTIYYQYDHATMGFVTRPPILAYRERMVSLLKSGTIRTVLKFNDGRVAYYADGIGLQIV